MKQKYIDEKFKDYFIFGTRGDRVDLNDGVEDICSVTEVEANRIMKDQAKVKELLYLINEKYHKEFKECYYEV